MRTDGLQYVLGDEFQEFIRRNTLKWDKEWMRYLNSAKDYSFYFYNMDTPNYALLHGKQAIAEFTEDQMYHTKLTQLIPPHVYVPGSALVDRKVLEIGCGPGVFGRIAARFTQGYVGIDTSRFALSIARLTSPAQSRYVHLSDTADLESLKGWADTCVSRHFFIHQNYESSRWLLALLRDLTTEGGTISADFFSNEASLDGGWRRRATAPTNEEHPSTLYDFQDDDIRRIAGETGLECIGITYKPELETRFGSFRVRTH